MKTRADLQQGSDPAVDLRKASRMLSDARKNFKLGALPRTVASNDANRFTLLEFKGDVLEGPDGVGIAVDGRRMTVDGRRSAAPCQLLAAR